MYKTSLILGTVALMVLAGCKSEEDRAREALSQALEHYALMQDEAATTPDRITAGQSFVTALDAIKRDYATTDIGLEIASGGTVGGIIVADVDAQITDLEALRAFEMCDEAPTPVCVVDRYAQTLGVGDRGELMRAVIPEAGLMMAAATGETEIAVELFRTTPDGMMNAFVLSQAPVSVLTSPVREAAFQRMDWTQSEATSIMAAHRVLTGETAPSLRDIVREGGAGQALLTVLDDDRPLAQQIKDLEANHADTVDGDGLRRSGEIMNGFGMLATDDILTEILLEKHTAADVAQYFMNEWSYDFGDMDEILPPEHLGPLATQVLADPEADPRNLSLALMAAPLHLSVEALKTAVDGLAGREVQTWDNIRVFPPLVALGYIGDRALYDAVVAVLIPAETQGQLEHIWEAGRALAEGRASEGVIEDGRLFRATVTVASARAEAAELEGFLKDAAARVSPGSDGFGQELRRGDIVAEARSCGLPGVIAAMVVTEDDINPIYGSCDRVRLGTSADVIPDDAFALYLDWADLSFFDWPMILGDSVEARPDRAYAFVKAVEDPEGRAFLTGLLALRLSRVLPVSGG